MHPSHTGRRHPELRADAPDANALIDELVGDLVPVQPLRWQAPALGVLTAMAIGLVLLAVVFGLRADLMSGKVDAAFLLSSGLLACLTAASVHAVIGMARPQVGATRHGLLWAVAMAALLPGSAAVIAFLDWLQAGAVAVDMSEATCLAAGVGLGMLVGVVLVGWLRRGAPTSLEHAGWLVGLASGAAGTFVYSLHCPHDDILHVGLWHGGAVVVSALVGRVAVPSLIRW